MNIPAGKKCCGMRCSVSATVESTAPILFARAAKAPASTKIHTISITRELAAPREKVFILSSNVLLPRITAMAYIAATTKAAVMGIL